MSRLLVSILPLCLTLGSVSGSVCISGAGGHWASWSGCPVSCGGAYRIRHCYADNTIENERCGADCFNGAEFYSGHCHCRRGTLPPCCVDVHECESNPCLNGGICIEMVNEYKCDCPVGTTGTNCVDIPECVSNPCLNGGICDEGINHFTCTCPTGTLAPYCNDILECASNPCLNDGTCVEHVGGYTCQCVAGTTGQNCVDIPECASNPCQNGGMCIEQINGYKCNCTRNFAGDNCEKYLFLPSDTTCLTHGDRACYVVFKVTDTWKGAKDFCEAREGHLFVPDELDEQIFLETYLTSMSFRYSDIMFWIGGTRSGTNSAHWVTGSHPKLSRWALTFDPIRTGDTCIALDGNSRYHWQARSCDERHFFICEEKVPFTIEVG